MKVVHIPAVLVFAIVLLVICSAVSCGGESKGEGSNGGEENGSEECAEIVPLRFWTSEPAAVALVFGVKDCQSGELLGGLDESAFVLKENGRVLSSSVPKQVASGKGHRAYINLLVDISQGGLENRAELEAGLRGFVEAIFVEQGLKHVYVGIDAFDGSRELITLQLPTRDRQELLGAIDELSQFRGPDGGATNLYGAVRQAVEGLRARQKEVIRLNYEELVTTGHVVLFTGRGDTASFDDYREVREVVEGARRIEEGTSLVQTYAVALRGEDYDQRALYQLMGGGEWVIETGEEELSEIFARLGQKVGKQAQGVYLATYCSSSRGNWHVASVDLVQGTGGGLYREFEADGFSGGCTAEVFGPGCAADACGEFCGACADETHFCDSGRGRCVSHCTKDTSSCLMSQFENSLGYRQSCADMEQCDGQCIDTSYNDNHCGGCGVTCSPDDSRCLDGVCVQCPGGKLVCGGRCVDMGADRNHCGACGVACPEGSQCVSGECICSGRTSYCEGQCVDYQSDTSHCGGCGQSCGVNQECIVGNCILKKPRGPQVSAGQRHTCGVKSDGSVSCWGYDYDGQLSSPSGRFGQVSVGGEHTCGVKSDGSVSCWGSNGDGQSNAPSGSFVQVSAGDRHTCGVKIDGSVSCWGSDYYGQSSAPSGSFVQVSAGQWHSCGVKIDGSVSCWGSDGYDKTNSPSGSFVQISAGNVHTCGVKIDGSVSCWGSNGSARSSPPSGSFVQVSAGGLHTCGVKSNGRVSCWGSDLHDRTSPPSGSFVQVSAGDSHTCGVKIDGSVSCWGRNDDGQSSPPSDF